MPATREMLMLSDALGVPAARLALASREPFGVGSVAGYEIAGEPGEAPRFCFVDTSGLPVQQETGLVLGEPCAPDARVWQHPADPHLPALPAASFADSISTLLARGGLTALDAPEMVAYRPGRRAVIRVRSTEGVVWVKVVPPRRIDRIRESHLACSRAGVPVPRVRFWSPEGLIVLESAEGRPATHDDAAGLLAEVDLLRAELGRVAISRPARGVLQRLDWYSERLPQEGKRLADRIRAELSAAPAPPRVVVHGDLHIGQLFLDEAGRISGLIDVDTLGLGDAAEDPAAFLSHAVASAITASPVEAEHAWSFADAAWERWGGDARVPPLAAIHLLGHALSADAARAGGARAGLFAAAEALLDRTAPSAKRGEGRRSASSPGAEDENPLIDGFGGA